MDAEIELGSSLFVGHGATLLPNSLLYLAATHKTGLWETWGCGLQKMVHTLFLQLGFFLHHPNHNLLNKCIFLICRRANQQIKLGTIKSAPTSSISRSDHLDVSEIKSQNNVADLKKHEASLESLSASNYSLGSSYDHSSSKNNNNDSQSTTENGLTTSKRTDTSTESDDLPPAKNRARKFTFFATRFMHRPSKLNSKDTPQLRNLLHEGKRLKKLRNHRGRERRATLTIAIIVMAFVICWLPFSMLYLIDKLCSCGIKDSFMFTVIFWLGYCNSAVNPVLYSIFNRDFRLAFQRLLCKRRKR